MKDNQEQSMNKATFIHSLSERSGFTIRDTQIFFEALICLLRECIENRIPFMVKGFGSLIFSEIAARMGWHKVLKKMVEFPPTVRVTFRLAKSLRDSAETMPHDNQLSFLNE